MIKMNLGKYIATLLYQYDCIIVPRLGGFVANYKSATIQPIQNTFLPPSKSISFNKNLNANDGLLANFIAQQETISFDESSKIIAAEVIEINKALSLSKRFVLAEIGTLFLDVENRIQFEPANTTNYLLKSYGLPIYQKQPIKRISLESKITQKIVDKTVASAALQQVAPKKSKQWMYSAALVLLAFGVGWMTNNSDWSNDLNYANLSPYSASTKAVYSPLPPVATVNETKEISFEEQLKTADEKELYTALILDENEVSFVARLKATAVEIPDSTYVDKTQRFLHYHIIAGCFSEKKNAKKMVKMLKKEGFEAFIVGKRKGLWAVSCNSFETKKEAANALSNAQAHNAKAWILHQSF